MDIFSTGYTASDLVANATTAGQTTFASLGGVIEVVVGIVLALVLARYVIGLFKTAGRASGK